MHQILVVDNNSNSRMQTIRFLTRNGYDVTGTTNEQSTIERMKKNKPDLVLCDFNFGDMTDIRFLGTIKEMCPEAMVIITTSNSSVKEAVEVLKQGAYDYIAKPISPDKILMIIKDAFEEKPKEDRISGHTSNDTKKIIALKSESHSKYITGTSVAFAEITSQIDLVAPTNFSVIIYGESGSGKEAIAQQIHEKSNRAGKPFVAIDCGALSKELSGSELFGHEKGAFTGALNKKIGCLEIANEGTIFLDEISNLPYEVQVSLLRVVQERKIRRVGGVTDIDIDIRIIVASNTNLRNAGKGKFREDLYHRLNEFIITLPSLRERKQDIMLFAKYFLEQTNIELGKNIKGFTKEVANILMNYIWHGNIRELKNAIRRATLLTKGELVELKSLPFELNCFNQKFISPIIHQETNTSTPDLYEANTQSLNLDAAYEIISNGI